MNQDQTIGMDWKVGEFLLGIIALVYFLTYPRNTLTDFIVLTSLCFVLLLTYRNIGLVKPPVRSYSKADTWIIVLTILLFVSAWGYGVKEGRLNSNTAIKSLWITIGYFYYALIQHYLAERYLALRLLSLVEKKAFFATYPFQAEFIAAILTGFIFGVIHIPYPALILPAMLGGGLYAYYFLITGKLWMVVSSHALVSSTLIFWVLDDNPFTELMVLF